MRKVLTNLGIRWLDGVVSWGEGFAEPLEKEVDDGVIAGFFVGVGEGEDEHVISGWDISVAEEDESDENLKSLKSAKSEERLSEISDAGSDDEGYASRDRATTEKVNSLVSQSSLAGDWAEEDGNVVVKSKQKSELVKRAEEQEEKEEAEASTESEDSAEEDQELLASGGDSILTRLRKLLQMDDEVDSGETEENLRKKLAQRIEEEKIEDAARESRVVNGLADGEDDWEDSDNDFYPDEDLVGPWGYLNNDSLF